MRSLLLLLLLLPIVFAGKRVLLISLDGFRHGLLTKEKVPNLYKFANERSSWFTSGVKSQMLTVTASNHMSIISGLREDKHGIVGNYFWDRTKKEMYDKFFIAGGADIRKESELSKWNPIDPIWLLNQKNGGKSTVINWPAGDYERSEADGVIMTRYRHKFGDHSKWPAEKDMVVDALATNNLVLWYIAEPDSVLHGNGFNNGKLEGVLTELDTLFDQLIKQMEENGVLSDTDIIITADHGHIQVEQGKTLCVNNVLGAAYTGDTEYHAGDSNIYHTNPTKVQGMFNLLQKYVKDNSMPYKVYLQKDVPASWHYVNSERTGDIVIEPLAGGQVKMNCKSDHDDSHTSTHGQDPNLDDMRALLAMSGPSFKAAAKISETPENIDLFPLMLQLLNITTAPSHDGQLQSLQKALRRAEESNHPTTDQSAITQTTTEPNRPDASDERHLITVVLLTFVVVAML